jgi:hypothetical protein
MQGQLIHITLSLHFAIFIIFMVMLQNWFNKLTFPIIVVSIFYISHTSKGIWFSNYLIAYSVTTLVGDLKI